MSGEYMRRLALAITNGVIDRATANTGIVRHDHYCAALVGEGDCDCDPDITIHRADGRIVQVLADGTIRDAQ